MKIQACPKKVNFALWYIIIIRLLYLKYLSTFIGLYNWHQKVYQWASCQNHVAMLSPIWISWSFHANPVAKFDSIKCLHHHFLFSSLLGYKLYNLDDIQNFFLLIVVYDIHSALNIEFKVYNQIFLNVGSRIILFTLQITTLEKQVTKKVKRHSIWF